jgi:hypothetical protein
MHQPFVADRLTPISYNDEREYLLDLSNACRNSGLSFTLRLHPRAIRDHYEELLRGTDIEIDDSTSLFEAVKNSRVVLGQYSTALFAAILMRRPLLTPPYPGLKVESGDGEDQVGIVINKDLGNLEEVLTQESKLYSRLPKYDAYISKFIGNNNSYQAFATTIDQVIRVPLPFCQHD